MSNEEVKIQLVKPSEVDPGDIDLSKIEFDDTQLDQFTNYLTQKGWEAYTWEDFLIYRKRSKESMVSIPEFPRLCEPGEDLDSYHFLAELEINIHRIGRMYGAFSDPDKKPLPLNNIQSFTIAKEYWDEESHRGSAKEVPGKFLFQVTKTIVMALEKAKVQIKVPVYPDYEEEFYP